MYTHYSFVTAGAFTLLRPIFVTLVMASLLMFLIIILPKLRRKMTGGLAVVGLSLVSVIVSGQLLYYYGVITDELGLRGDLIATSIFFVNLIFCIVNPIIFYTRRK
ncbi:hypothetical protein M5W83_01865 [Paenibacillus thiaminolyticus]|uniref:Uncharacterized protein n=1 Tax=Paenibacillus thiaminolyticus TaxID=49283 RepID=A0AAP9J109_PANTH|nr:hypothetical protein [Paenibacillus thiaminolyticus]MCY9535647.1 hypothetical protein [Paenibacillus thiaminolyticus]MCY9602216.1 hypothetical protein [Paenibacillus thiaminolyticus]MCY9605924.1 hypothetical protein [Paenibacillus thiaminolyticus]MCY9612331.1 hypothetical protein [Paenibacillus thiaminolyticus]MCY9619326.1 hypothetical protein [Paenibacillus thiaminolyticus]